MEALTACLLPPSNIDRAVGELQHRLFARCGATSALALPVLIPVALLPAGVSRDQFRDAVEGLNRRFVIRSSDYAIEENALFLDTAWEPPGPEIRTRLVERLARLRSHRSSGDRNPEEASHPTSGAAPAAADALPPSPFPCRPGLYLGQIETPLRKSITSVRRDDGTLSEADAGCDRAGLTESMGPPPELRFSSFCYALIRIVSETTTGPWWNNVWWQVDERIRAVSG